MSYLKVKRVFLKLARLPFSYSKQLHIHMSRLCFFAAMLYGINDLSNVPTYTSYVTTSLQ